MSPYKIASKGGSVDHWNEEPGGVWLTRHWCCTAWLNPVPQDGWTYAQSTGMVRQLTKGRMCPLTPGGLDVMIRELSR